MADDKPIIIIKKKGGHGGHHGGAWKVAYADFVTAMMAFFMVMWLVNSADVTTRQNIASYFKRPGLFSEGSGTPLLMGGAGILDQAYVPPNPSQQEKSRGMGQQMLKERSGTENLDFDARVTRQGVKGEGVPNEESTPLGLRVEEDQAEKVGDPAGPLMEQNEGSRISDSLKQEYQQEQLGRFQLIAEKIRQEIIDNPRLAEVLGSVNVQIENDGLLVEILDTEKISMFKGGSAELTDQAKDAFAQLASILKGLENKIEIEGHTDAVPMNRHIGAYTNWELSSDRAQTARRFLEQEGISRKRITRVAGRADRELRVRENPFSKANRRILLKLPFDPYGEDFDSQEGQLIDSISKAAGGEASADLVEITPSQVVEQLSDQPSSVPLTDNGLSLPQPSTAAPDPVFEEFPVLEEP